MKKQTLAHLEKQEDEKPNQAWMMTFADLLSLVLTFFVLLYSMSALESNKWEEISQSLAQKLNPSIEVERETPAASRSIEKISLPKAMSLDYLSAIIADKFRDSTGLQEAFTLQYQDDRLVISLIGKAVFEEGNATPTEDGGIAIFLIGDILQTIGNHIDIYGTAPMQKNSEKQQLSGWELSLSRAAVVSKALRNMGYEYKITSFGRAPATPTGEESEKSSQRVDIVIRSHSAEL